VMVGWIMDDRPTVVRLLPLVEVRRKTALTDIFELAGINFYLGNKDRGFELLEESFSLKEQSLFHLKNGDALDGIREDPRYLDLLKRLELD